MVVRSALPKGTSLLVALVVQSVVLSTASIRLHVPQAGAHCMDVLTSTPHYGEACKNAGLET